MTRKELQELTPFPWQQEALEFSSKLKTSFWFVNGGGGKTKGALMLSLQDTYDKIVVIVIAKLVPQWKEVVKEWDNVEIMSTQMLARMKEIPNVKNALVIFDECDFGLSTTTTQTYKNISKMNRQCKKFLGLSATLLDVIKWENTFTFFKLASPKYLITDLKLEHCVYEKRNIKGMMMNQIAGYKNIEKLKEKASTFTYINIFERPIKNVNKIPTLPTYEMQGTYMQKEITGIRYDLNLTNNNLVSKIRNFINHNEFNGEFLWDGKLKYDIVKNLCSGIYKSWETTLFDDFKFKALDKILQDNPKAKGLVYYSKKEEYNILKERYPNAHFAIDNDMEEFKKVQSGFMFCQYVSLSRGADIEDISTIIYFSPTEKYQDWKQAYYRLGRNGCKFNVVYEIFFKVPMTLENKIWEKILIKKDYEEGKL